MHRLALLLALGMLLGACTASRPAVKVLGVTDAIQTSPERENLIVFVQVVNPTNQGMTLSRLEYRLDAESWFQANGEVALARPVGPQSATVVQVPVRMRRLTDPAAAANDGDEAIAYSLQGRLFAVSERVQRSWDVKVKGTLSPEAVADTRQGPQVQIRIADGNE